MLKFWNLCLISLVIAFLLPAGVNAQAGADESVEPSDTYRLVLNDQEIALFTDRDVELPENAGKARTRLVVNPEKHFVYGDIELSYPRYFTFEADLGEPEVKLWSLSGNKTVLMVQRYPVEMDHRTMAEQLVPSFGEGNSRLGTCEMVFNGNKTPGSRVITTIGEGTIAQEIYSFAMKSGSLLLIIQDTLDNGNNSEEFKSFRDQLSRTFKITEAEKK
ncbi:MAG: hypothetical protein CVV42_16655 [Candidatus Riflebacteria bacterium HGW-Riflebacteria-2]|jgi:hypothetical protein|nr:MAG: hypothetical protein CVV42_16655 [Candidatus Riflebacteria bacterium HGW-Riflebacteria-2]